MSIMSHENSQIQSREEYLKIMGLNQPDYGSRAVIKRDVLSYAKRKGYATSAFHTMPKAQLKTIALNHKEEDL